MLTLLTAATASRAVAGHGRVGARPRLAAIDWAMAETAIALGANLVALAELPAFRRASSIQPKVGIPQDLGLRGAPNMEALALLGPDLILSSNYYSFAESRLSQIAPVFSRAIYEPGNDPFMRVMALPEELGAQLDDLDRARSLRREYGIALAGLTARARQLSQRNVLLIQIGDSRHMRVFGHDSLFGGLSHAIGLRNAWTDATRFAFAAPVPMTHLTRFADADLVVIGAVPHQARRALARGALWNSLPQTRAGRVYHLPEFSAFGAVPSALAFGSALVTALEGRS